MSVDQNTLAEVVSALVVVQIEALLAMHNGGLIDKDEFATRLDRVHETFTNIESKAAASMVARIAKALREVGAANE